MKETRIDLQTGAICDDRSRDSGKSYRRSVYNIKVDDGAETNTLKMDQGLHRSLHNTQETQSDEK